MLALIYRNNDDGDVVNRFYCLEFREIITGDFYEFIPSKYVLEILTRAVLEKICKQ